MIAILLFSFVKGLILGVLITTLQILLINKMEGAS